MGSPVNKGLTSNARAPSSAQAQEAASGAAPRASLTDLVKALAALSPEERQALTQLLSADQAKAPR